MPAKSKEWLPTGESWKQTILNMNEVMKIDVYISGGTLSKHWKDSNEDSDNGWYLRRAKLTYNENISIFTMQIANKICTQVNKDWKRMWINKNTEAHIMGI